MAQKKKNDEAALLEKLSMPVDVDPYVEDTREVAPPPMDLKDRSVQLRGADHAFKDREAAAMAQAADLERQAQTPMARPSGVKEHLVNAARAFMEGMSNPQNPAAMEMRREDKHGAAMQDLVNRAKALRGEATQQQQMGQAARREETDQMNFNRQQSFQEEQAAQPKPFEAGAGTAFGSRNPQNGDITIQGRVPTAKEAPADKEFATYTRDDGKQMVRFVRAGMQPNQPGATYELPAEGNVRDVSAESYGRREGDIKFQQERALAQQFQGETNLDRQRLQSYQNLQSLKGDLTGSNQIAVLYNFIRLMDPNRVSDQELVLAQGGSQSHLEKMRTEFERIYGVNVFSPEGAARLMKTADVMAGQIQTRVGETAKQYQIDAQRYGLDQDAVVRGAPQLYRKEGEQDPSKAPAAPKVAPTTPANQGTNVVIWGRNKTTGRPERQTQGAK